MTSASSGTVKRRDLPFLLGESVVAKIRLQSEGEEDVKSCRKRNSASVRALYQDCRRLGVSWSVSDAISLRAIVYKHTWSHLTLFRD